MSYLIVSFLVSFLLAFSSSLLQGCQESATFWETQMFDITPVPTVSRKDMKPKSISSTHTNKTNPEKQIKMVRFWWSLVCIKSQKSGKKLIFLLINYLLWPSQELQQELFCVCCVTTANYNKCKIYIYIRISQF